jgi:hypothetical protein
MALRALPDQRGAGPRARFHPRPAAEFSDPTRLLVLVRQVVAILAAVIRSTCPAVHLNGSTRRRVTESDEHLTYGAIGECGCVPARSLSSAPRTVAAAQP